jgi:hypothetical protein
VEPPATGAQALAHKLPALWADLARPVEVCAIARHWIGYAQLRNHCGPEAAHLAAVVVTHLVHETIGVRCTPLRSRWRYHGRYAWRSQRRPCRHRSARDHPAAHQHTGACRHPPEIKQVVVHLPVSRPCLPAASAAAPAARACGRTSSSGKCRNTNGSLCAYSR